MRVDSANSGRLGEAPNSLADEHNRAGFGQSHHAPDVHERRRAQLSDRNRRVTI